MIHCQTILNLFITIRTNLFTQHFFGMERNINIYWNIIVLHLDAQLLSLKFIMLSPQKFYFIELSLKNKLSIMTSWCILFYWILSLGLKSWIFYYRLAQRHWLFNNYVPSVITIWVLCSMNSFINISESLCEIEIEIY